MEPTIKNDVPPSEEKDKKGEEVYKITDRENLKKTSIAHAGTFWLVLALVSQTIGLFLLAMVFYPFPGYELSQQARTLSLVSFLITIQGSFFCYLLRSKAQERKKHLIKIEELESDLQYLKEILIPDLLREEPKPAKLTEKNGFNGLCNESSLDYLPRVAVIPEILKRAEEIGYKPKDGKKFALVENRVLQDCALRTAVLETYKKQGRKEPAGTLLSAYAEIFKTN